jgi:hypothetical protein
MLFTLESIFNMHKIRLFARLKRRAKTNKSIYVSGELREGPLVSMDNT